MPVLALTQGRAGPLLPGKLAPPTARPRLVPRRRLLERLEAGLDGPLTLLVAPAGFGKTTLLAAWLASSARHGRDVAWLALDPADNDPARFWRYLIAAIQAVRPSVGRSALALLHLPRPDCSDTLVGELVGDLAAEAAPLVLVLDDYHTLEAPEVHAGLAALLKHLPPQVHLVLSSRGDPPLPIASLRARGRLTEVRAPDLRFTPPETAAFLADVMGLDLSAAEVDVLEAHTEGWVAGLQLAALSLQARSGPGERAAFVAGFGGSHRFVLDYLVEEILQHQPERVGAFLRQTSILERLSGPLCAAVTGEPDSQALLEEIERANLFLVPLDEERRWYRYHHLFAGALRHQLAREAPGSIPELHRRASAWCAAQGLGRAAVEHALAAEDWPAAARLIDAMIGVLHARGERETVRRWLQQIPQSVQRQFPLLVVSAGQAWLHAGEFDRAAEAAREARAAAEPSSPAFARALLLEANLAVQRGQPTRAVACAEQARALLPADDVRGHASATVLLVGGSLACGDLRTAERVLAQARPPADQPAVDWLLRTDRGVLDALRGRLPRAAEQHRALLQELGDLPVVYAVEQRWRLALIHLERDELDQAERYLDEALGGVERAHGQVFLARIHLARARLLSARGDLAAATAALDAAESAAWRVGSELHQRWVQAGRAALRLRTGDVAGAERWAATVRGADDLVTSVEREPEALVLARVELARRRPETALRLLAPILRRADAAGAEASAIAALVLEALAHEARGAPDLATASLAAALRRARPGGFRRVFLELGDGQALVPLLRRARGGAPELAASLLTALEAGAGKTSAGPAPVSAREREVLALLAEGLGTRQIAERLIVAPNTVKAHVHHLGTKLGASGRLQLVARAREAGLVR
jgi:LuxR family transcriptional regulator, maltose regulon positive regulatory protein